MGAGTDPHYIRAGWLFDGSGQSPQRDVLLRVENGRFAAIESIGASAELPGVQIEDYCNCSVLPPLVDCHVHLCMSGATDPLLRRWQLSASYQELRPTILENISTMFHHGVLAVRDGGDGHGHTLRFKAEGAVGKTHPVAINVAGRAWHRKGRYGRLLGCCPQDNETLAHAFVRDCEEIDQLKIIQSGINSLTQFGKETAPQFSLYELKEAVAEAHELGLQVMIHANGKVPVRMAIDAGCDSIEHGFFMGIENIERMAENGTTWIATAYTMQVMAAAAANNSIAGVDPDVAKRTLEQQLTQLAWAREYGVKVAVGTDSGSCGVFHGSAIVKEMKLLLRAGYSLPETIQAATANGAELLGMENIGCLTVGKPATFLVAEASPATLLSQLPDLQAIYVSGRPCGALFDRKS